MSCCAVARAQHLGQNGRFAQQPRDFGRATFFATGEKKIGALFSNSREAFFFFKAYLCICVCNMEIT